MKALRAVVHASELLTGSGIRAKEGRYIIDSDLGRIPDGAMVYSVKQIGFRLVPHQIEWVGRTKELPKKYRRVKKRDLQRKQAVVPGFVDCHTHLIFAGDRSEEFSARCAGATYEQIAAQGGGILSTVRATQEASLSELETLAVRRIQESASYGVKTLEIKSGYGLSVESELKILKVIPKLRKKFPEMTLMATFLGAHAFPKEKSRDEYLSDIIEQMLPEVAKKRHANACDVFIDKGYFTLEEGKQILRAAHAFGLRTKIHADELINTESAALAVELGALSADHLLKISDDSIQKLAHSKTVAVLLPGTAFYLKAPYAPSRKLLDAGAIVALATDFNPGTCVTLNLPAIMTLAALYMGMTRAEIFAAVTYNGARALGLHESKGTLELGLDADFTILPFKRFDEVYYRFAWSPLHF